MFKKFISKLFLERLLRIYLFCIFIFSVHSTSYSYSTDNFYFEKYGNSFLTYSECDRIFVSSSLNSTHGTKNGTFIGPNLPALGRLFEQTTPDSVDAQNVSTSTTTTTTTTTSSTPTTETTTEGVTKPELKHARQCIYTFIAGLNERVRLAFTKFKLRSETPE